MSDLESFRTSTFSKRQILGLCNGVYDPIGIASPYTIKLKLLIRETLLSQDRSDSSSKKSWDKPIPQSFVNDWASLVEEGIKQDVLPFSRSVRPAFAVHSPTLVGFFDGSSQAVSAVVYIR